MNRILKDVNYCYEIFDVLYNFPLSVLLRLKVIDMATTHTILYVHI